MGQFEWVASRISDERRAIGIQGRLDQLIDACLTLEGKSERGVFGLWHESIELSASERETLMQQIRAALRETRNAFQRVGDFASLLELGKLAEWYGWEEHRVTERFPLLCDPLGDPQGLSQTWLHFLARLRLARDGASSLAWSRVAEDFFVDEQEPTGAVLFGQPDQKSLYAFALKYEHKTNRMFPRELASFWSVANGISAGDSWYLAPVSDWRWREQGLRIGSGHYCQGCLCIQVQDEASDLLSAPVVDFDDDGVECYRYETLAGFFDLLLPDK